MQARIKNPASIIPNAMTALVNLAKISADSPVPAKTLSLVHLRVSQINGCAVCIDLEILSGNFLRKVLHLRLRLIDESLCGVRIRNGS